MPLALSENLARHLNLNADQIIHRPPGFNAQGAVIEGKFVRELLPMQMLGASTPSDQLHSLLEYTIKLPHSLRSNVVLDTGSDVVQIESIQQVVTVGEVLPQNAEQLFPLLEFGNKSENLDNIAAQLESTAMGAVDVLVDIHNHKKEEIEQLPSEAKKNLYLRGTGAILANRDLTFGVLDFAGDNGSWVANYDSDFLSLMMRTRNKLGVNPERLRTIHGDFWWANLYRTPNGEILATDPRIGIGEPAGDLTAIISELLLKDFMDLGEFGGPLTSLAQRIIDRYQAISGDADVQRFMPLNYGFKTLAEAVLSLQSDKFSREILATGIGVLQSSVDGDSFNLNNLNDSYQRGRKMLEAW